MFFVVISTVLLGSLVASCIVNSVDDNKVGCTTIVESYDMSLDGTTAFSLSEASEEKEREAYEYSTDISDISSSEDLGNYNEDTLDNTSVEQNHNEQVNNEVNGLPCVGSTTEEMTTAHTHTFVMTSSCMYYPEEGHYEKICVAEGYTENVFEYYDSYCYYCGTVMDDWGFEALLEHSSLHGAYGTYERLVDTIWHEPVYENIWVIDVEEYYEEEMVVECIECGYIERSKFYGD